MRVFLSGPQRCLSQSVTSYFETGWTQKTTLLFLSLPLHRRACTEGYLLQKEQPQEEVATVQTTDCKFVHETAAAGNAPQLQEAAEPVFSAAALTAWQPMI